MLPDDERIVAIEDTLELRIEHSNCVRFEARGLATGAVTIRDLVRHALRHRPDHIVVGEVRGGEAADLLQALNTGHGGSLTTVHANNAEIGLVAARQLRHAGRRGASLGGHLPGRGGRHCDGDSHDPARGAALRGGSLARQGLRRATEPLARRADLGGVDTMRDEEKIIRVKTFKDFERELGRYGDETLEVPAWIAEQYLRRVGLTTQSQRILRAEFSLVVLYGE